MAITFADECKWRTGRDRVRLLSGCTYAPSALNVITSCTQCVVLLFVVIVTKNRRVLPLLPRQPARASVMRCIASCMRPCSVAVSFDDDVRTCRHAVGKLVFEASSER